MCVDVSIYHRLAEESSYPIINANKQCRRGWYNTAYKYKRINVNVYLCIQLCAQAYTNQLNHIFKYTARDTIQCK